MFLPNQNQQLNLKINPSQGNRNSQIIVSSKIKFYVLNKFKN